MPRPIICQNLVFDRTGLKKTRLTTSGTSMPVSSMSTEMAICGAFRGLRKVVDQRLGVVDLKIDDPGEMAHLVRVIGVEPLRDERGVVVVLGEDDGLAQFVAIIDLQPVRHQVLQHLSTVSALNSHLLSAGASTLAGTSPSSSHSSASHFSFSSSESWS